MRCKVVEAFQIGGKTIIILIIIVVSCLAAKLLCDRPAGLVLEWRRRSGTHKSSSAVAVCLAEEGSESVPGAFLGIRRGAWAGERLGHFRLL